MQHRYMRVGSRGAKALPIICWCFRAFHSSSKALGILTDDSVIMKTDCDKLCHQLVTCVIILLVKKVIVYGTFMHAQCYSYCGHI